MQEIINGLPEHKTVNETNKKSLVYIAFASQMQLMDITVAIRTDKQKKKGG